jgi:hypothetical protein
VGKPTNLKYFNMTTATVLQFMQKTAEDEALRHQLESLLGVGDGNISSESELDVEESAALKGERAPVVTEFAASNGFNFSVDELITVVDAFQKHQTGELSDKDFAVLLGVPIAAESRVAIESRIKRFASYMKKTYLGY